MQPNHLMHVSGQPNHIKVRLNFGFEKSAQSSLFIYYFVHPLLRSLRKSAYVTQR
jgi:hypothetical protein